MPFWFSFSGFVVRANVGCGTIGKNAFSHATREGDTRARKHRVHSKALSWGRVGERGRGKETRRSLIISIALCTQRTMRPRG